jgi:class 3 adenylate cyclase
MAEPIRKLAAIIFTDIAGFTALSAQNEEHALELLEQQRKIVKPIVAQHKGSWLKEIGDGLLLCFSSSKEAVLCAIDIQQAVRTVPDLDLRIGIHEGDIVEQAGDIVGDDVNIASRIEPFAPVGGIALSDKVQRNISSSPEFETTYVASPSLKGVRQKVEVYCLTSHGLPKPDPSKISAKLAKSRSGHIMLRPWNVALSILAAILITVSLQFATANIEIAGLLTSGFAFTPTANRIAILEFVGETPSMDRVLCRTSRSELYQTLQEYKGLRYIGDHEIFQTDITGLTLRQISAQLNSDYLVSCTLTEVDKQILLEAELYSSSGDEVILRHTGYVLVGPLQSTSQHIASSIGHQIVEALGLVQRLSADEIAMMLGSAPPMVGAKDSTFNTDIAYNALMQAHQLLRTRTSEANLQAIILLDEALLSDSANADLLVALAEAYHQRGILENSLAPLITQIDSLVSLALSTDSLSKKASARAYYVQSLIYLEEDHLLSAREAIRTAMQLDRNDPDIRNQFKTITQLFLRQLEIS